MWIVIIGDPVNGLSFHGTFEDSGSAVDWAKIYAVDSDWWVSEVGCMR